jgi:hypothetical protein
MPTKYVLPIDWLELMYWEGQKNMSKMDDKDKNHHDRLVFVAQIVWIDDKSM